MNNMVCGVLSFGSLVYSGFVGVCIVFLFLFIVLWEAREGTLGVFWTLPWGFFLAWENCIRWWYEFKGLLVLFSRLPSTYPQEPINAAPIRTYTAMYAVQRVMMTTHVFRLPNSIIC